MLQELAELVATRYDMTDTKFSVKPDKNTTLQEAVNQISGITREGRSRILNLCLVLSFWIEWVPERLMIPRW